jgi:CHAD domain-containing protein
MPVDNARIEEPVRKVRKFLKRAPKSPTPDEIHDLRTNTRRLEATIQAFGLDSNGNEQHLLRELKRVHKRAGKVRDMDVLTEDASNIHLDGEQSCVVQVLEHLGTERTRHAKKLRALVKKNGSEIRQLEKQSLKDIEKLLQNGKNSRTAPVEAMANALQLSSEFASPARLDRKNLHAYRLKVKELRYVLQLASDSDHQQLVEKLGEVKDAIGEWHDWEELIGIANAVVDHEPNCKLLREMKAISNSKFARALSLTNEMRDTYFPKAAPTNGSKSRDSKSPVVLTRPVLTAISAIAA